MTCYDIIIDVLSEQENIILGNPWKEAQMGVLKTVKKWVEKCDLPEDVFKRYLKFIDDENILYFSKSYRDHFFHAFHNFLLGFQILYRFKDEQNHPFGEDFQDPDKFLKKWLLTCLWHDLTYILEKGGSRGLKEFISSKLEFDIKIEEHWTVILTKKENIESIDNLSEQFESDASERRLEFREWLQNQLIDIHDHGIVSAILLLKDSKRWEYNLERLSDSDITDCGLAIALHNYHKSNKFENLLLIKKYPLAFLLSYCDSTQEWGRPSAFDAPNHLNFSDSILEIPNKSIATHLEVDFLKLEIEKGDLSPGTKLAYDKFLLDLKNRRNPSLKNFINYLIDRINIAADNYPPETERKIWQIYYFYKEQEKIENTWESENGWLFASEIKPFLINP